MWTNFWAPNNLGKRLSHISGQGILIAPKAPTVHSLNTQFVPSVYFRGETLSKVLVCPSHVLTHVLVCQTAAGRISRDGGGAVLPDEAGEEGRALGADPQSGRTPVAGLGGRARVRRASTRVS